MVFFFRAMDSFSESISLLMYAHIWTVSIAAFSIALSAPTFAAAIPPIAVSTPTETMEAGDEMNAAAEAAYFGESSRNLCNVAEETELPSFREGPLVASSLPFLIQRLTVSGFVWSSSAISFTLYDFIHIPFAAAMKA